MYNGKGRLRSPPPSGHSTEVRRVMEKDSQEVSAKKAHQSFRVKVRQGKRTDNFVQTSRKEVAKGATHVIIGMFPNVQNSMLQVDADSETSVCILNTQLNLLQREIQHLLQFTFQRMMNNK